MNREIVLETPRLFLRRWREADREPFARMNADARVMEFFPAMLDRAASDALYDRIQAHFARHGFGLLALEERATGDFLGFVGISVPAFEAFFTPAVEIGWRLAGPAWGRGYATEGARAVLAWSFDTFDLSEIVSFTSILNERSMAVMRRLGMVRAGEFDHPLLDPADRLRRHVLYRIRSTDLPRTS